MFGDTTAKLRRSYSILVILIGSMLWVPSSVTSGAELDLSAKEIVARARQAAKERGKQETVYTFVRNVVVEELNASGQVRERKSKTFRAYTDQREQELLTVNGKEAGKEDIESERQRSRRQKRRFLNADPTNPAPTGGRKENLMDRNITLFHEKFEPELLGEESVRDRQAYVLNLKPNPKYRIKHSIVDRIFNRLALKVWIDREDFEVAKLEARLTDDVTFLGGIAGAVRGINIRVDQVRLGERHWVDQTVRAFFDARFLWKAYHFGMQSVSEGFEAAEAEAP